MPYPQDIIKLVVSGTGPETETWAWSLSLADVDDPSGGGGTFGTVPAGVASAVETFHATASIATNAHLTSIKYNMVGPDGRYLDKFGTVEKTYGTPIAGGGSGFAHPLQMTAAVTLLTANERGLASRGRFFIPYPGGSLTNGRFQAPMMGNLATAAKTMINAINAAAGGPVVVVASSTRTGAIAPVTRVQVGDRPDTLRSRGAQLRETYTVASL